MRPALTFLTPTYRRPQALAACLASVGQQTAREAIEQIVLPDHVGVGIAGMYARLPAYVPAVHGRYVHLLQDDDVLVAPDVVEQVLHFVTQAGEPPVVLVGVQKGPMALSGVWPPICGQIDLGNLLTRADVWAAHVETYGRCYEGDYFYALALSRSGHQAVRCPVLFVRGAISRGRAEVAA